MRAESATDQAPNTTLATTPEPAAGRPDGRWVYWRIPVTFGVVLCIIQVALVAVRFGAGTEWPGPARTVQMALAMGLGLVLFFVGGVLTGLLVQRLLRGCQGGWRTFLISAVVIASPFAVLGSLVGGLLGPPFVVLYALFPYLLLVGVPVLIRKGWHRLRRT